MTEALDNDLGTAWDTGKEGGWTAKQLASMPPDVRRAMTLPTDERRSFIRRDLWIGYDAGAGTLSAMEDMLAHPRVKRMPCLLLAGPSDNGKSTILERFKLTHPQSLDGDGKPFRPVVIMDMPEKPTEATFWSALLTAMTIEHNVRAPTLANKTQTLRVLGILHARMLVIDEIHNVLQTNVSQQRQLLALLKNLCNATMIAIVAAGTQDALRTLRTDAQFAGRFDVIALPSWRNDVRFRRMLATLEILTPLARPSRLADKELADAIYAGTNGTIGTAVKWVKEAACLAVGDEERVTVELLKKARGRFGKKPMWDAGSRAALDAATGITSTPLG